VADQLSSDLASLRIQRGDEARPPRSGAILRVVVTVALLAGGGVGAYLAWPHVEASIFKTEVAVTQISSVSPAQASTQLTATGYVVARTLSRVAAKVPGRVARVLVVEGQQVHEGDVLIELDTSDQASAIASARARAAAASARVAEARANLAEVDQQLARARTLAEHGAGARSVVDDLSGRAGSLRGTVTAAQAEVRAAGADVEALRVGERSLTITAPISGTVITEPVEVGEMVSPAIEVLQIADFASMIVEIDVPETRLSMVRIGGPCEVVLDAFPGRRFRGEAAELGRRVNRAKATVPVRVRFVDPTDGVLPDMSARVSFLREALSAEQLHAAEQIVVPVAAITRRGGQDVVFVIDDGTVHQRALRLGATTPDGRVVLDGPPPGTRVVARPPSTLAEGQSIKERTEP